MATFLVNAKMHPDLAARVDASVNGGRRVRGRPRPGLTAAVRIVFFLAVSLFLWVVATTRSAPPNRGPGGSPQAPAVTAPK